MVSNKTVISLNKNEFLNKKQKKHKKNLLATQIKLYLCMVRQLAA